MLPRSSIPDWIGLRSAMSSGGAYPKTMPDSFAYYMRTENTKDRYLDKLYLQHGQVKTIFPYFLLFPLIFRFQFALRVAGSISREGTGCASDTAMKNKTKQNKPNRQTNKQTKTKNKTKPNKQKRQTQNFPFLTPWLILFYYYSSRGTIEG